MGQSSSLTTESAAMRAFESAIARAKALPPRARRRVLDWADERITEAVAGEAVEQELGHAGTGGSWGGVTMGSGVSISARPAAVSGTGGSASTGAHGGAG